MTIALGILCDDGVVLGVDTQISVDDGKIPGPKILIFKRDRHDMNVVAACYGHSHSMQTAGEEIEEELSSLDGRSPTVREIRAAISKALDRFYVRHVDPIPYEYEQDFMGVTLLVAIRVGVTARLFCTNRSQVVEVNKRWCMGGSGHQFATYATTLLLGQNPSVELAAQVAAYVIGITKLNVEGVGHATDVHVIESDGRHWSLHAPDVKEIESGFDDLFKTLQFSLSWIDSRFSGEEDLPQMLGLLGDKIRSSICVRVRTPACSDGLSCLRR